ncbi:MAG: RHS repeat-associated core domain-containing protein, partial [Chitinophagales bacterium]|nr:RHS repeat-associated core domain-containing protein [Chitinophagales bacterium]
AQVLTAYDALSRPVKVWAKEQPSDLYTLRQVSKYAENELGITAAKEKNIVGQLYQHFDEAGLNQIERCDYKGNPLEKVKQVISDATLLASGTTSYTVDWTNSPSILDSTEYRTTIEYDALNRGTKLTLPKDINNHRAVIEPVFNTAGALERIKKDNVEYVKHIAYNAKGQQLLVVWKNDIMMRFAYDEQTFRLKRVKAERYTIDNVNPNQYNYNSGNTRYDQSYVHDLVGNILEVKDRTPDCGISGSTAVLDRMFEYDAIYRLIYANGREMNTQGEGFLFADAPEIGNATASNCRYYEQDYEYDKVGNIQKLRHRVIGNTSLYYTRNFIYNTSNNQHTQINNNQTTPTVYSTFTYDAVGNMLTSNADRFYTWDTFGSLKNFELKAGGTTSRFAHYLYDASGTRVKKIVINDQGKYESVTYIDGVLELHTRNTSGTLEQKNYLHLMGGIEQRIGSYGDDISDALIYHITDHLGSAAIRLDGSGAIIDKEEYYPYGDSSLRTFTKRRFRYIGKERDEESGLYQMGARYYAPWTCKFLSVDPLAVKLAHQSSYCYA